MTPMFESLNFDKNLQFGIIEKSQRYIESQINDKAFNKDWYSKYYVLRGPVIGHINRTDLAVSQSGLGICVALLYLKIDTFGFTIDHESPYRYFYFQQWRGTNSNDLNNYGGFYATTGNQMETPFCSSIIVWNPQGKIVYEQVNAVLDRLRGNTEGISALFGMCTPLV